jgi:hypothetical protein
MKRRSNFLFGLLFLFFCKSTFSQQLTMKELQNIYYEDNISSIDYLLGKKKFTLKKAKDEKIDDVTYKILEWSIEFNGNEYSISKYQSKNWLKSVTLNYSFSNNVSLYLKLKYELMKMGFKNINIENPKTNTLEYTYTNGMYNVVITQYNPNFSSEENWYHIALMSKL